MPHAALWVVQPGGSRMAGISRRSFNAARGFVGGAAARSVTDYGGAHSFQCRTRLCGWCSNDYGFDLYADDEVSMPHAALWVVQLHPPAWRGNSFPRFNAARGFVGGAAVPCCHLPQRISVSMPHAALWVVQLRRSQSFSP